MAENLPLGVGKQFGKVRLPRRIPLNPGRDQPQEDRVGPDEIAGSAVTCAELQDLCLTEPDWIQQPDEILWRIL